MKKFIVLLLAGLILVSTLNGCVGGSSAPDPTSGQKQAETSAEKSEAAESKAQEASEQVSVPEEASEETTEESSEVIIVSWTEMYNLGLAYFSMEEYEEAITAFTEAIEVNAEQAPVYVSRGDAYVLREASDEKAVEENLDLAWTDYETASKLDQTLAEAYLGMADVLIRREEFDEAHDLLVSVQATVSDQTKLLGKVQEIEAGTYKDSSSQIRRKDVFDPDGSMIRYTIYEYDGTGRRTGWRNYTPEAGLTEYCVVTFGDNGLVVRNEFYYPDGTPGSYQTMEYDENGLETRRDIYSKGEHVAYYVTYYDEEGKETGYDGFYADGTMFGYWRSEYDQNGNLLQEKHYNPDGTLVEVLKPSDE